MKSELALEKVNQAISFIAEKFDTYEQERTENGKKLKNLMEQCLK